MGTETITVDEMLQQYTKSSHLDKKLAQTVLRKLREETISEVRKTPNRQFALDLLNFTITSRQAEDPDTVTVSGEDLMFASYLLGIHNQIEDCLKIWEAKNVDFDSYSYVDIQLVVFAGVDQTLEYLTSIKSDEATRAIKYILGCQSSGDFDDLDTYFSPEKLPWWI